MLYSNIKKYSFVGIMKSSSIRCQTQHTIRTHALAELKRHKIIINVMPRPRQNNSVFIYCKKRVRFRYFCSPHRQWWW